MSQNTAQNLDQITISELPEGFLFEITGDQGGALNVQLSAEQLDALIEALDQLLADNDDALSVDAD